MSTVHRKSRGFERIFDHYSSDLFRFCHLRIKDQQAAEDIVINTFAKFWKLFGDRFCHFEDTRGTLFQAVYLLCDSYINNTNIRFLSPAVDKIDATQLLDQLPTIEKQVILLFYFKKLSLTQISAKLNLPIPLVKEYKLKAETSLARVIHIY